MRLIKFLLTILSLPIVLVLFVVQVGCGIVIGMGSIVTNIGASLFLFGAVAEWAAGMNSGMVVSCAVLGVFFLVVPHVAEWLVDTVVNLSYALLDWITGR